MILFSVLLSIGLFQTPVPPTPWPTVTPMATQPAPTSGPPSFPTSALDDTCPAGVPSGYGVLTPSAAWMVVCGRCLPSPTVTATLDYADIYSDVLTPNPGESVTPVPGSTLTPVIVPTGGGVIVPTCEPLAVTPQLYAGSFTGLTSDTSSCTISGSTIHCSGVMTMFDSDNMNDNPTGIQINVSGVSPGSQVTYTVNSWESCYLTNYAGCYNAFQPSYPGHGVSDTVSSPNTFTFITSNSYFAVGAQASLGGIAGTVQRYTYSIDLTVVTSCTAATLTPPPVTPTSQPAGVCSSIPDGSDTTDISLPGVVSYGVVSCYVLREQVSNWNFTYLASIRPPDNNINLENNPIVYVFWNGYYDLVQAVLFWFLGLIPNVRQCFESVSFATVKINTVQVNLSYFADILMLGWIFDRLTKR